MEEEAVHSSERFPATYTIICRRSLEKRNRRFVFVTSKGSVIYELLIYNLYGDLELSAVIKLRRLQ